MSKKLTDNEVAKIADLIKINISPKEQAHYTEQLNKVLEAADIVKEVKTENIKETSQTHGLINIVDEDRAEKGLDIKVYPNRTNLKNGYFVVRRVI